MVYGHWGYPLLIFPTNQGEDITKAKIFNLTIPVSWFMNKVMVKV